MKLILIILLLLIILIIWAIIFPTANVTIRAENIRSFSNLMYQKSKVWCNNRLQTHRLRQSLVKKELLLAHSQQFTALSTNGELHELAAKAFRKVFIFQRQQKTRIVIPIGSPALIEFAENELNDYLLTLLINYYPTHHWQPITHERLPLTNYYYLLIKQK